MLELIEEGGVVMIPLLVIAAVVVALGARAWLRMRTADGPDPVLETGIDATLFWGAWALLLGLLGTAVGIYQAAGALSRAGQAPAGLVWGGIHVALTTTVFGLVVFSVAALLWFGLRTRYRRQVAAG